MASQSVTNLEGILKDMGYTMAPGHKPGVIDAAFVATFQPALQDLLKIGFKENVPAAYTPDVGARLNDTMKEKVGDGSIDAMQHYVEGKTYAGKKSLFLPTIPEKLGATLAEEGFHDHLLEPKNVAGVIKFMNNSGQYIADINAIMPEQQKILAAGASATTPATPVTPAAPSVPAAGDAAQKERERQQQQLDEEKKRKDLQRQEQQSPQAQLAQQQEALKSLVKNLQQALGYTGADLNGEFTPALQEKLKTRIREIQGDPANGWQGTPDGLYSPQLQKILDNNLAYAQLAGPLHKFRGLNIDIDTPIGPQQTLAQQKTPGTGPQTGVGTGGTTGGAAGGATGGTGTPGFTPHVAGTPLTDAKVKVTANETEIFLSVVANGMNEKFAAIKKESMMVSLLLETSDIPLPDKVDGEFNMTSRASLQGILKAMQNQLELSDEEIFNYSPATGEKIKKNASKLPLNVKQKQDLEKMGGIGKVVDNLNILHDAKKLEGGQVYDGSPMKLTGIGASILQWLFRVVGQMFPPAVPLLNEMLKKFTGGLGYTDLMPNERKDAAIVAEEKRYMRLPSEDRLKDAYAHAFAEAKKQGPAGQEALQKAMKLGVDTFLNLPMGTPAARKAYEGAVAKALAEAGKQTDDAARATVFAKTFNESWKATSNLDPNTGRPIAGPHGPIAFKPDPTIKDLPIEGGNADTLIDTYEKLANLQLQRGQHQKPIVFKQADGSIYASGVTSGGVFTAKPVSKEAIADLEKAIGMPDQGAARAWLLGQKHECFELLVGGYSDYYPLKGFRDEIQRVRSFPEIKNEIDRAASGGPQHANRREQARANAPAGPPPPYVPPADTRPPNPDLARSGLNERYVALSRPTIIPEIFAEGRMVILICEKPNDLRSERDRFKGDRDPDAPLNRAMSQTRFYSTVDITDEFLLFKGQYDEFCKNNTKQMKGMTPEQKLEHFVTEYKRAGGDFVSAFPKMASVLQDQQDGHWFYPGYEDKTARKPDVASFEKYLAGQIHALPINQANKGFYPDEYQPRSEKWTLKRAFGRSDDKPVETRAKPEPVFVPPTITRPPSTDRISTQYPPAGSSPAAPVSTDRSRPVDSPPPSPNVVAATDGQFGAATSVTNGVAVAHEEFRDNRTGATGQPPEQTGNAGDPFSVAREVTDSAAATNPAKTPATHIGR